MTNPDCLFCQQPLTFWEDFSPANTTYYYAGEPTWIYQCKSCQSQQDFDKEKGQLTYYNFRIGLYWLRFFPKYNKFALGKDPPDEPGNTETILHLDFIPKLTPQNTTIERIKLFLLFS